MPDRSESKIKPDLKKDLNFISLKKLVDIENKLEKQIESDRAQATEEDPELEGIEAGITNSTNVLILRLRAILKKHGYTDEEINTAITEK